MPSRVFHDDRADELGCPDDPPRKHSHHVFTNQAFTVSETNTSNGGAFENGNAGARLTGSNTDDYVTSDDSDVIDKDKLSKDGKTENEDEYKSLLPFCIVFGLGSMFTQSIQTYLASQITVIEKVFDLSSTKSGFLLSANDIGFCSTVLFASHFLKNKHIPRVLAGCVLLVGVSGMLSCLPQFLPGHKNSMVLSSHNASHTSSDDFLCVPGRDHILNKTMCSNHGNQGSGADAGDGVVWVLILLAVMMIIQGVAKAPRQPLGNTYIDNNSIKTSTGFYLSVLSSFTIFGPFMAQTLGGVFNKIPVDLKETSLSPDDPRWIGAWWLGFIVFGACSVLFAVPVFFFPASLKKTHETQDTRSSEYMNAGHVANTTATTQRKSCIQFAAGMPRSIMRVFSQPIFATHVFATLLNLMAIFALGTFGPKYVENQFNIPTWKANIIQGIEKLSTTSIGTLAGGIITKRLQLRRGGCLKMIIITRTIGLFLQAFNFMFGCDNPQIIGYDIPSRVASNMSCICSDSNYLPVCADGNTYFSPCHAGCRTEIDGIYSDCSASVSGDVHSGMCDTGCNYLIPFVAVNALSALIQTAAISPSLVIVLRSVKEKDRPMAIGIQSFMVSLLGMRMNFISIDCGIKVASLLLSFATFYFIKRQASREEHNTKEIVISKPPVPQPRTSIGGQEQKS